MRVSSNCFGSEGPEMRAVGLWTQPWEFVQTIVWNILLSTLVCQESLQVPALGLWDP
jgi:hypothetical protein